MTRDKTPSRLLSVCLAEGTTNAVTGSKLAMLMYFLEEESTEGANFGIVIDEIMKVAPHSYGRVIAYLRELNCNLATDSQADPRKYARKVLRAKGDPT